MKVTFYTAKRRNMCDGRYWHLVEYAGSKRGLGPAKVCLADGAAEQFSVFPTEESLHRNMARTGLDRSDYIVIALTGDEPSNDKLKDN